MKKSKAPYSLFVGIDISKGKADAALLQVFPDRSRKDKMSARKSEWVFPNLLLVSFIRLF